MLFLSLFHIKGKPRFRIWTFSLLRQNYSKIYRFTRLTSHTSSLYDWVNLLKHVFIIKNHLSLSFIVWFSTFLHSCVLTPFVSINKNCTYMLLLHKHYSVFFMNKPNCTPTYCMFHDLCYDMITGSSYILYMYWTILHQPTILNPLFILTFDLYLMDVGVLWYKDKKTSFLYKHVLF